MAQPNNPRDVVKYRSTDHQVMTDARILYWLDKLKQMNSPSDKPPRYTMKHRAWKRALKDFPEREYADSVLRWNKEGWVVTKSDLTSTQGVEENYKDTIPHFENILKEFTRFIAAKYMWGPFPMGSPLPAAIPPKDIRIWPVFVKTEIKDNNTLKHRLLINLSDNKRGVAYNEAIQSYEKRVAYIDIRLSLIHI